VASFEPAEAADFLATLHVAVVQPLLRYEGGSSCYLRGIPGDRPRERFTQYQGDLLTDYVKACHARGIKVVGGLYLDWRRFEQHLDDAPAHVAKNDPSPERKLGQPVCPLNGGVWEHNLSIVRTLLDNYPDLDGVILDDNFEFDRDPCYCPDCLARFAAYCERQPGASNPRTEVEAGGALWRAFWKEQVLSFCKRIHDLCAAHGKPVGGWTAQRGPIAFRGVFDFAGDMVYVEPPCSVAPLWPQIGDFPVVTLLWGMNRRPEGMEADVVEAIRAGSDTVGFWIQYARQEGVTDNPWSLGWTSQQGFALTPGSLGAIERAFAGAEQAWRDYYRDNLIQGDARFVITRARLEREGLTVAIQRLDHPASQRVMGPIDLAGLSTTQDPTATREAAVRQGGEAVFGDPVETDAESRAAVYLLGGDERPADNIYGEQPYGDATGRRIAIRYYSSDRKPGGISVLDLGDGSRHDVLVGATPFPAFHAWGEYLYYHETVDDVLWLRRCSFLTLEGEDVAVLPPERGAYSYGTVSPDHRYYAVSVTTPDMPAKVHLLDLVTGEWSILLDRPGYHAKHEQFSMDGRNRVLIQLNQMPDVKQVLLSELEIGGPERPFPADRPHTPRPTGHEAWVGATSRILFSTGHDADSRGNLWTAAVGDPSPTLVYEGPLRFSHVSVSRCGRYWIGDTGEEGIPIYIGSFASGRCRRAVFSRTIYDGKQWAHAHPYLTADNRWLIFTSTRDGHPQVYGARLAEEWLEAL